ncbi:TRAP transporter substrate-binding protein DctP [Microbaculum marinum]|uniref:TRAP transporter substrate-binding protein DctP n=1 Tax=Microbaculum marinum TaxID=1764581 RepID=A0AAW9RNV9_9HYPH
MNLIHEFGVVGLASTVLLTGAGLGGGIAHAADFNWKLFTPFTVNDKPTQLYRAFAEDVEKATGGKLKIDVYAAGELPYKNSDVLRIVATNQVEMADLAIGPVAGEVPELNVFVLPFICTSMDQFYAAADEALPIIDGRLQEKFGVRGLTAWTMPPQEIWLTEDIGKIEELKGRKIRTWNKTQVEMLDLLGASGVAITPAEVIPALQRGVVDGAVTAAIPAYDWKFYEVLDYGYMLNFTMTNQVIAVNEEQYAKLPDDVRAALDDTVQNWQLQFREAIETAAVEAGSKLEEEGMELIDPSESDIQTARDVTKPMWNAWAEENGPLAAELLKTVSNACSK